MGEGFQKRFDDLQLNIFREDIFCPVTKPPADFSQLVNYLVHRNHFIINNHPLPFSTSIFSFTLNSLAG